MEIHVIMLNAQHFSNIYSAESISKSSEVINKFNSPTSFKETHSYV